MTQANRFLHHMVRNLVGLLVEIGRGKRGTEEVDAILAARDRRTASKMAPACGLFLEEVAYPEALLDPRHLPPDYTARKSAATDQHDQEFEGDQA